MAETRQEIVEVEWYGEKKIYTLLGNLSVKAFYAMMESWKKTDPNCKDTNYGQ